jgi:hypothetical protein
MTLEELNKLSKKELRQKTNEAFAQTKASYVGRTERDKYYAEARFYIDELERRSTSWISIRDLILEIFVIALIGWEIHMGYRQESQQAKDFDKQQIVLKNMETSSEETAKLLQSLDHSMESTKNAVQGQLAVFYDPSVLVRFIPTERLNVLNNGHTNITLWGSKFGKESAIFLEVPNVLPPNGGYEFHAEGMYRQLSEKLRNGQNLSMPYEIYIKNELGHKFVVECTLTPIMDNLQVAVMTQINAIAPREWQKK